MIVDYVASLFLDHINTFSCYCGFVSKLQHILPITSLLMGMYGEIIHVLLTLIYYCELLQVLVEL